MFLQKVFAAATLILGALLITDAHAVNCDQKCRHRTQFFYCSAGPCLKLTLASCLLCGSATNNNWCSDQSGFGGTCTATDMTNSVVYWSDCTQVCDCNTYAAQAVEASVSGSTSGGPTITLYTCQ
jgi:hypothetical protein